MITYVLFFLICVLLYFAVQYVYSLKKPANNCARRAVFVHLDLGIGGAERLVVDAGVSLKQKGYDVIFFTSHHDPKHCFSETIPQNGQPALLEVRVFGAFLPHLIFNSLQVVCAIIRMNYVAIVASIFARKYSVDVIFVDGVSACIPFLKLAGVPIIFYCHFPDKELATHQVNPLGQNKSRFSIRKLYRYPFDKLEEVTTGMANLVLVNSAFTKQVFKHSFPSLGHISPSILYPIAKETKQFDPAKVNLTAALDKIKKVVFLSINRFDPKKNLPLAIDSYIKLRKSKPYENISGGVQLVLAGGYDRNVAENVDCFDLVYGKAVQNNFKCQVLNSHLLNSKFKIEPSKQWDATADVVFIPSLSEDEKSELLWRCCAVLYTPSNEHFGIVPLEAMSCYRPVIACNSGGPKESIGDETCGFLCFDTLIEKDSKNPECTAEEFSEAMLKLANDEELAVRMGVNGAKRVESHFSRAVFGTSLFNYAEGLINNSK